MRIKIWLAALFFSVPVAVWGDIQATTIAVRGQDAGGIDGFQYVDFMSPAINNVGQVLIWGHYGLVFGGAPLGGVWVGTGDAPARLIARQVEAPGGSGFLGVGDPVISDNGRVALTTGNNSLLVAQPGQSANVLLANGDPAPGTSTHFTGFSDVVVNASRLLMIGHLSDPQIVNPQGIYVGPPDALTLVVRDGSPAPGTSETYAASISNSSAVFAWPQINRSGQVAFAGFLTGDLDSSGGIWAGAPQALQLVARTGDQAPGLPDGVRFARFLMLSGFSEDGKVAIWARATDSADEGVWAGTAGNLKLVAKGGQNGPGMSAVETYANLSAPIMSRSGQVAFGGYIQGPGAGPLVQMGTWADEGGGVRLLARNGLAAPGTGGAIFNGNQPLAINGSGEVLFLAGLSGGRFDEPANSLWIGESDGTLHLLLATGDKLMIDGQLRSVAYFNSQPMLGSENGWSPLNDAGQVALDVQTTDGVDAVIVLAVPEPGGLGGLIGLVLLARRRHSRMFR